MGRSNSGACGALVRIAVLISPANLTCSKGSSRMGAVPSLEILGSLPSYISSRILSLFQQVRQASRSVASESSRRNLRRAILVNCLQQSPLSSRMYGHAATAFAIPSHGKLSSCFLGNLYQTYMAS